MASTVPRSTPLAYRQAVSANSGADVACVEPPSAVRLTVKAIRPLRAVLAWTLTLSPDRWLSKWIHPSRGRRGSRYWLCKPSRRGPHIFRCWMMATSIGPGISESRQATVVMLAEKRVDRFSSGPIAEELAVTSDKQGWSRPPGFSRPSRVANQQHAGHG
jgi:hypothetical protein